eukprot:scaffold93601_cov67-Phaeocystis_antarctica.AAC.2
MATTALHGGQIVSFKGRVAITKSGTKYYLGSPSPLFEAIRLQLCRATAAAEQGPPHRPRAQRHGQSGPRSQQPTRPPTAPEAHPPARGGPLGPKAEPPPRGRLRERLPWHSGSPVRAHEPHCLRPSIQAHGALLVSEAARSRRLVCRVQRGAAWLLAALGAQRGAAPPLNARCEAAVRP